MMENKYSSGALDPARLCLLGRVIEGHENPDGEFGPTTEKAVKNFQGLRKLEADGEIGADTWTALLTA